MVDLPSYVKPPPDDYSAVVIIVVASCFFLTTPVFIVRLYTRARIVKQLGLDDYFATLTQFLVYGVGLLMITNRDNGLGKHKSELTEDEIFHYDRSFYIFLVVYNIGLLSMKGMLLIQYYRLFSVQSMRILYIIAMVLVACWSVAQVCLSIFTCVPVAAFWDKNLAKEGQCLPQLTQWYINAGGNIVTQTAILVLPLPVVGSLNLATGQKAMLISIFSLGFITVALSIVRINFLKLSEDYTRDAVALTSLSIGELTTTLVSACILTLRPVMVRTSPPPQLDLKRSTYYRQSDSSSSSPTATDEARRSASIARYNPNHPSAIRYLASMESREGLYDDKYMLTASNYELERRSEGVDREQVSFRQMLMDPRERRPVTAGYDYEPRVRTADSMNKPFATTNQAVITRIGTRTKVLRSNGRPTPKWEIGVHTEVIQTTCSRC